MPSIPIDFAMAPYIILSFSHNYAQKSENKVKVKLTKGYIEKKMKEKIII